MSTALERRIEVHKQVCSDSGCGQKQSVIGYFRGTGYFFTNGWYCSHNCLVRALTVAVRRGFDLPTPEILIHRRGRIGSILIQKGLISRDELQLALERQKKEGGLIGEWLVELTEISERELMTALSEQQGVPWLAKTGSDISKSIAGLLPKKLCFDYKIFPFEFNKEDGALRVAAKSPIDGLLLHMLRTMLGYEIQFFIVSDQAFADVAGLHLSDQDEAIYEEVSCGRSAREVSELILKKADEYGFDNLSFHFFDDIFWIRFTQGRKWRDLFISVSAAAKGRVAEIAGSARHFLPRDRDQGLAFAGNTRSSVGT